MSEWPNEPPEKQETEEKIPGKPKICAMREAKMRKLSNTQSGGMARQQNYWLPMSSE